jgi:hypothetical protein
MLGLFCWIAPMQYPRNDLDRPNVIQQLLGSFWSVVYQGQDFVGDLCSSKARLATQAQQNLVELLASVSRYTIPVFHREYWTTLTIRESHLVRQFEPAVIYDATATAVWSAGLGGNQFGQLLPASTLNDVLAAHLHRAPLLVNRMLQPSVTLVDGIDYRTDFDRITFYENPFHNNLIPKVELLGAQGEVIDREITLWIYGGEWDLSNVYNQFGYALSLYARSSENYKTLVNAILDATTIGTTAQAQRLMFAATTGIPVVVEAQETVEYIVNESTKMQIITDQHVYTFAPSTVPTVVVGQEVYAGDTLTDALQLYELHRGSSAILPEFDYLTISSELLHGYYLSGLTFVNDDVPLDATATMTGDIQVSWQLLGPAVDVQRFWQEVRQREQSSGVTLGQLIHDSTGATTPLTLGSLPTTINPLQFLVDNLLRANAAIVRIRHRSGSPANSIPLPIEYIRRVQPPHTHLLILQEFLLTGPVIDPTDVAGPLGPWYSEELYGFDLMSLTTPIDPSLYLTGQVTTIQGDTGCNVTQSQLFPLDASMCYWGITADKEDAGASADLPQVLLITIGDCPPLYPLEASMCFWGITADKQFSDVYADLSQVSLVTIAPCPLDAAHTVLWGIASDLDFSGDTADKAIITVTQP